MLELGDRLGLAAEAVAEPLVGVAAGQDHLERDDPTQTRLVAL